MWHHKALISRMITLHLADIQSNTFSYIERTIPFFNYWAISIFPHCIIYSLHSLPNVCVCVHMHVYMFFHNRMKPSRLFIFPYICAYTYILYKHQLNRTEEVVTHEIFYKQDWQYYFNVRYRFHFTALNL